MDINLLISSLKNDNLLKEVIYFPEIESTNAHAQAIKLKDDALVVTDFQTRGKGRFGRVWSSQKGLNLAFTLIKKIKVDVDELQLLNLYTAYSLIITFKKLFPDIAKGFSLKWPNDILLNDKKVSGILIEVQNIREKEKVFLIGIGVNVNQTEFDDEISNKATSISRELNAVMKASMNAGMENSSKPSLGTCQKTSVDRERILIEFVNFFYKNIGLISSKGKLIEKWESESMFINKKVKFRQMDDSSIAEGIAKGLDDNCGLKIEFDSGTVKTFYSGEISFVY